jgi:SAM-dependent methyltransferase
MSAEPWEAAFARGALLWGEAPSPMAVQAAEDFAAAGLREVLILGVGYGRNARPFLERGLEVQGVELSATAISLARERLGLRFPIHHGAAQDLPPDSAPVHAVFGHALLHLLDAEARARTVAAARARLRPGGRLRFTLISTDAAFFGQGARLGDDRYERAPGVALQFFREARIRDELGPGGALRVRRAEEPAGAGPPMPFFYVEIVPGG